MNDRRQIIVNSPLYLSGKSFCLLFFKCFIPIKVDSYFSDACERTFPQMMLHLFQFLFIILFYGCGMQADHRMAVRGKITDQF